jgi:integrase
MKVFHLHPGKQAPRGALLRDDAARPAEVSGLLGSRCALPERGWGLLTFGDSSPAAGRDITDDGQVHEHRGLKGRPRKAVRRVPIPPQLVALLREHMERFGTAPDGRIFRSVNGARIQPST